jgi:site-specific DNA-methyltransferase (adenine-specific)
MILADLPYEKTARNTWDKMIPLDVMWDQFKRITTPNAAIVLTAIEPFTSMLVMSNLKQYRHRWVWNKNNSAGFANAKKQPFQITEDVLVFGKSQVTYYPKMEERGKVRNKGGYSSSTNYFIDPSAVTTRNNLYYPKNILNYSNASQKGKVHPTQKPLLLFEYLIETYTRPGDLVVDPVMGSGTSAEACINLRRCFIGIENDPHYYELAFHRAEEAWVANGLVGGITNRHWAGAARKDQPRIGRPVGAGSAV